MLAQLAQEVGFVRPAIDWHAVAPELTLLAFGALVTVMDIVWLERGRRLTSSVASIALLVTMIPIITLALDGEDRVMFGGAFVVDNYALVMKAMFLLAGYVVVLLSTNYVAEGDYWVGRAGHWGTGLIRHRLAATNPLSQAIYMYAAWLDAKNRNSNK